MSQEKTSVFVEGDEDCNFLKSYIDHLLPSECEIRVITVTTKNKENKRIVPLQLGECEIRAIEGKNNLKGQCIPIQMRLDRGARVLIVFDADDDYERTKSEIEETLRKNGVEKTKNDIKLFLFPDNKNCGQLEDLLEEIIKPEHKKIFECFEDYKKCLEKNTSYQSPNIKAKIYAYKLALGAIDIGPENHFDSIYWDFDSPSLLPIKKFITENFSQSDEA